jgi:hypothetical protein
MRTPPSREQWRIDAELNGHTVEQVIAYLSACDDAAEQVAVCAPPPNVILAGDCEPRWLTRLRARFGR